MRGISRTRSHVPLPASSLVALVRPMLRVRCAEDSFLEAYNRGEGADPSKRKPGVVSCARKKVTLPSRALSTPSTSDATEPVAGSADGAPASASDRPVGALRSLLSAAVYSLGFTIQRAIGLLLLPVYTRAISPAEYGTLGVLIAVYGGVGVLFSAALETSINRNYFQLAKEPARQQEYLDSVWRFLVVYPLVSSVVLSAVAWPFAGEIAHADGEEIALTLVASALFVAGTTLPLTVLRARHDLRGYLWMTAVTGIGTVGLTLVFVVGLDLGVKGWMAAAALANAATLLTALAVVPWNWKGSFNWPLTWTAVVFSLPLIPHLASHWALQVADRGVIAGMVSGADLGVYTLAANIASVVMMLVIALNQAFVPTYARAGAEDGVQEELDRVVMLQIAVVVALTLGAALTGPPLVELLTPASYHEAAPLVPWLALGYGFLGLYFIPMNGATLGVGRRTFAWVATAISAGINIGLLFLLVPTGGITAAAVASAAGYLVLLVLIYAWAHARHNPVRYEWRKVSVIVAAALAAFAAGTATAPEGPAAATAVGIAWFVLFAIAAAGALYGPRVRFRAG